jgi:hypothetical protein
MRNTCGASAGDDVPLLKIHLRSRIGRSRFMKTQHGFTSMQTRDDVRPWYGIEKIGGQS